MIWLIVGFILTVIHILLFKYVIRARVYKTRRGYSYYWTGDAFIRITYGFIILLFLVDIIPYFGLLASIIWWIAVLIMSIARTKNTSLDEDYTVFVVPCISEFLNKEI